MAVTKSYRDISTSHRLASRLVLAKGVRTVSTNVGIKVIFIREKTVGTRNCVLYKRNMAPCWVSL